MEQLNYSLNIADNKPLVIDPDTIPRARVSNNWGLIIQQYGTASQSTRAYDFSSFNERLLHVLHQQELGLMPTKEYNRRIEHMVESMNKWMEELPDTELSQEDWERRYTI